MTLVQDHNQGSCPATLLTDALQHVQQDEQDGLAFVNGLLVDYPSDARLHFLRGSVLAGQRHYDEAQRDLKAAVALDPDYAIARFQLGLMQLSSAQPAAADLTLRPLQTLPSDHALRHLGAGLQSLMRDDFAGALVQLRNGMTLNLDNPGVNHDMNLLINGIIAKTTSDDAAPVSAAQMLLSQTSPKATRH